MKGSRSSCSIFHTPGFFQTPVTMIAAFFILDEKITAIGIIGCVLIIGGLWLGDWLSRRHALRAQGR